ncbi:uncharacterized protein LOC133914764 [Phragmites australis]|uniref:uncharacterized protein LOC133914764 n=1 Tax=Phragmites australis TaxID=29695 RepID=UPI002D7682BC|nr:uncharacterized protein LOC133914764 [Phragmites australis]
MFVGVSPSVTLFRHFFALRPPTGAAESQGWPEAPRPAPTPEPSAPELSAPAEPGLASAAAEPGPAGAAVVPGTTDAAAEPGPADAAAEPGPADAAAETETQPPLERSAPSKPAPSAPSAGQVTAWQFSGTPSPPGEARRGSST